MASSKHLFSRFNALTKKMDRSIGERGLVDVVNPSEWLQMEMLQAPKYIKIKGEKKVNLDLNANLKDFTEQVHAFLKRRGCHTTDESISELWHSMNKASAKLYADMPGLD